MDKSYKIFLSGIIAGTIMFIVGIGVGQQISKQDSQKQIEQLQRSLNHCENMWKLDASLFYPELCQTVCAEEFEKMSC